MLWNPNAMLPEPLNVLLWVTSSPHVTSPQSGLLAPNMKPTTLARGIGIGPSTMALMRVSGWATPCAGWSGPVIPGMISTMPK
jgi:hypothetical protein